MLLGFVAEAVLHETYRGFVSSRFSPLPYIIEHRLRKDISSVRKHPGSPEGTTTSRFKRPEAKQIN
jgi:hypothetical protein